MTTRRFEGGPLDGQERDDNVPYHIVGVVPLYEGHKLAGRTPEGDPQYDYPRAIYKRDKTRPGVFVYSHTEPAKGVDVEPQHPRNW